MSKKHVYFFGGDRTEGDKNMKDILGGKGTQKGNYIISKDGKRDGENIWNAKDADGRFFIQSMVENGVKTREGEIVYERYPWKNTGDDVARWKIAAVSYFEPWDWVIGVGAYEDDFKEVQDRVSNSMDRVLASINNITIYILIGGLLITVLSGMIGGRSST